MKSEAIRLESGRFRDSDVLAAIGGANLKSVGRYLIEGEIPIWEMYR